MRNTVPGPSTRVATLAPGCLLLLATLLPAPASAQDKAVYRLERLERPALLSQAGMLGLNVLLGGASAGLVRALRGGPFFAAVPGGALGGGVVFAGKAVAAQRFSGAGLVGRQLAAVGGSMAGNAGAGAPLFASLELPFGPLRIAYEGATGSFRLRVDPVGLAVLTYAVVDPRFRFDARATLSSGSPVFHGDAPVLVVPVSGANAVGLELYSVILLADLSGFDARTRADILAHERIHTLQADAFQAFWGRALLEWLTPDSPGWQRVAGVLDVNLGEATAELVMQLLSQRGIWEIEADYIGR